MFDIFYSGTKPNLFVHEREAQDIEHAKALSRTRYFWWITYLADYTGWNFLWEPSPWQADQRHAWLDQYHVDAGLYLVPVAEYTDTHYHTDRLIHRLPNVDFWHVPDWIDPASINYRWAPNSTDPPYIYEFPVEWDWDRVGGPEYRIPGATERKYVDAFVARTQSDRRDWQVYDTVDANDPVFKWHPNPLDPAMIYVFGNQWWPAEVRASVEYHTPGATIKKYMDGIRAVRQPDPGKFMCLYPCEFDWSWEPDPGDPPYIYVFGNQWWPAEKMPTVEYHVPGATERKFMDQSATLFGDQTNWQVPSTVDALSIDYSWQPDPGDPPYIYEFATQWQPNGGAVYHVPGATERKYVDIPHYRLSDPTNWQIPNEVDTTTVNTSWHPDVNEPPYIYEFATQWQPNGGARYVVPGATEVKYIDIQHQRLGDPTNWQIPDEVDAVTVDTSWHPDATEQPYIYEFATQWQSNGGAVYHVTGATERKYVAIQHGRLPNESAFKKLELIQGFDYSWHPDNTEPPYNYVFGNQHWPGTEMPTVVYEMSGAEQTKFVDGPVAKLARCMDHWKLCEDIDQDTWDWTWVPNPLDPPYIYVWGNQWNPPEFKASVQYTVPGATEVKYQDRRTCRLPRPELFKHNLAVSKFDWSWEPNPFDPPMTYVFGNQWNSAVLEPTVIYPAGGNEIKYVDDVVATVAQDIAAWELLDDVEDFDYSWRPDPTDPPYIYMFGNQWLTPEQRPALQYRVAGATDIKYMEYPRARRRGNRSRFVQHYPVAFDWSWEPDPGSPPYNYVFGNQYYSAEVMPTVEYHMPGATETKYMDIGATLLPNHDAHWHTVVKCEWDYTWRPEPGSPAYIYVFGNQWWSAEKMPTVEYHMSGATERKYMSGPVAQLPIDMTNWHVPEYVDVIDMDFSWVPDPGEPAYIYQFATQHQKTGGPQYRMAGGTEFKYVDMMRAEVKQEAAPVFEIDHLDGNAGQIEGVVRKVRYFDNYQDTLIRLAKSLVGEYEHVWICSSICDYTKFDFSWHPETWQSTMLHVFASDKEKFGDTFYMHVPTFAERAEKKELLEWYSVNYVPRRSVPRRPMPVIEHEFDTHVEAIKTVDWIGPLAIFSTGQPITQIPTVPLWREPTKTIVPLSAGASQVIVPKSAVSYVKTQAYDYPYIDRTQRHIGTDQPLDIVFIDNGEPTADNNYKQLGESASLRWINRIHRSSGINGRVAAYRAAAELSQTPWFFAVFAKLQVEKKFDWAWQPDRLQEPKHYIFHAYNPITALTYGHQAIIAYNRQLVLTNTAPGLDFTLDQTHEVVPVLSGTAMYNATAWMAWRTAFRECVKLKHSLPDVENEYRLSQWLSNTRTFKSLLQHSEWSVRGAEDAVEYYEQVNGDFVELKKSYDWAWLASYAFLKRNLTPDQ